MGRGGIIRFAALENGTKSPERFFPGFPSLDQGKGGKNRVKPGSGTDGMRPYTMEIVHAGDARGRDRTVRFRFASGLEILGLATRNVYGGEWDYGSTWNYVVLTDTPFLVDTGRWGTGKGLLERMESAGVPGGDLAFILLSHGHEDHDGGLCEIEKNTGIPVKAHRIYERLIRFYPDAVPADVNPAFPASCWHCFMPESFSGNHCLEYHRERSSLSIETIGDGACRLSETVRTHHVPGHSPDALAVQVGEEAILVGDTVLPEITPFPSREASFDQLRGILGPQDTVAHSVFGLRAYIASLGKLMRIGRDLPGALVLPAHRLFGSGEWSPVGLAERAEEIVAHHGNRCAEMLQIVKQGPKTAREIAVEYFPPRSLQGMGMHMGENEAHSHCELLLAAGDVARHEDGTFSATGSLHVQPLIQSLVSGGEGG